MQNDTITPAKLGQFITAIIKVVRDSKDSMESTSNEVKNTLKEALSYIEEEHSKLLTKMSSVNEGLSNVEKKTLETLKKAEQALEEIKSIEVKDGQDADEEKIVEEVLSKIKLPEYKEVVLDGGEEIVDKINDLPITPDNQIDASHIKNLPKAGKGGLIGGLSYLAGDGISINGNVISATGGSGAVDSVNGQTGEVVLDADDIDDTSTTNKFVTASDLTNLSNLSGTNTGDQDLSGYALTGDIPADISELTDTTGIIPTATSDLTNDSGFITAGDIPAIPDSVDDLSPSQTGNSGKFLTTDGTNASWASIPGGGDMLASVYDPTNVAGDAFDMDNMAQGTTNKFLSSAELTVVQNTSGTNTGDQVLPTRDSLGLDTDDTVTFANLSGTNTGDQTLPVNSDFNLIGLGDVNDTGKATGKVLKYNSVSGDWEVGDDNNTTYTSTDFDIKDLTDSTNLRTTWSGKQDALTFGIANTNAVKIDHASVADNDYAKFTANGLEGRSYTEVKQDLDLEIGTDIQAYDAGLTDIAGLAVTDGNIIVGNGTNWVAENGATARSSLGLEIGTDVAAQTHASQHAVGGSDSVFPADPGADKYLKWNDTSNAIEWAEVSAGGGDVSKVGTPVDNQIAVWTGDGTIEGDTDFTWNGTTLGINGNQTITVADTTNLVGLTINQNDSTNNPYALKLVGTNLHNYISAYELSDSGHNNKFIEFYNNQSSPGSYEGILQEFYFNNSTTTKTKFGGWQFFTGDITSGAEYGYYEFQAMYNGTNRALLIIGGSTALNGISVGSSTVGAGIVKSSGNQDLILKTGNTTTGTITITDGANGDITLSPNGSGSIVIGTDIELGHASDTTISRVSAGRIAVEGVNVPTISSTDTFTNKTIDANGTGNSITNLEVADFASGVIDTDLSSVSGSDDTIPSAKATKAMGDTKALLAGSTSQAFSAQTLDIGNADTTISRSAAGVIAVEGVVIPSISSTNTLTNKRITKRVASTTDDATAVIDCDNYDDYYLTAVANDTTFSVSGTPTDGQTIFIGFKDAGVTKNLTWTGITGLGVTLPTATTAGKQHIVGIKYIASAWRAIAVSVEA